MKKQKRCKTCSFRPCRCEDLQAGYMGQSCTPKCWPMVSEALACHPRQVAKMNERNRKRGVSAYYTPDGRCHIPDRGERRRLLRVEKMHDENGGYGD